MQQFKGYVIKYIIMLQFLFLFQFLLMASCSSYQAVSDLDIPKYLGTWYQVYYDDFDKLFQNGKCSTAEYSMGEDNIVQVLNKELDKDNKPQSISGIAYYKEGDSGGYLTVKLENNIPAPYWVLQLGPIISNSYQYSIVSDDKGISLFVLARNVDDFYKKYNEEVLQFINDNGFDKKWNSPKMINQTNCAYF